MNGAKNMTRRHIKSILAGFLAMVLGVIVLAVILVAILAILTRDITIGPVYLLVPIVTFAAGCYWSLRRSSRPKVPAKPPSNTRIIAKSIVMGVTGMIVSLIAYLIWFSFWIPRNVHGLVSIDVVRLVHWPVLLVIFLGGFVLGFWRASRRRSMLTGGMAQ